MKVLSVKYFLMVIILVNIMFLSKVEAEENSILTVEPPAIIAVAYNPKVDALSNEVETTLDDFSFHLSSAIQKLKPIGVNFYIVEKQKVFFKFLNKTDSIDLAQKKAFVGYVFISSKGKVLKRFHVLTDIEILEIAPKHFDLKEIEQK